jgi:hypothetical protein
MTSVTARLIPIPCKRQLPPSPNHRFERQARCSAPGPTENRRNVFCDRRCSGHEWTRRNGTENNVIGPDWSCHLIASAHRAGAIPVSNFCTQRRMQAPREIGVG